MLSLRTSVPAICNPCLNVGRDGLEPGSLIVTDTMSPWNKLRARLTKSDRHDESWNKRNQVAALHCRNQGTTVTITTSSKVKVAAERT